MTFFIGQIFEEVFPPEASLWCMENNADISEIDSVIKPVSEVVIVEVPKYDDEGNLISEEKQEVRIVEKTIRRFKIVAIQVPSQEDLQKRIQKQLTNAVQRVLDSKAQELNYDSCLSVCSYVDTGVAKFDAEGRAFRAWRSAVWAKGYEILAQVQAGQRAIPTEEQLIAELPKLVINY